MEENSKEQSLGMSDLGDSNFPTTPTQNYLESDGDKQEKRENEWNERVVAAHKFMILYDFH